MEITYNYNGYCHIEENGIKYLLHQDGSKWRVATEISEIDDTVEAIDLCEKDLATIPKEVFACTQLKALLSLSLLSNKLKNLPKEIGQLAHLNTLGLSDNEGLKLPSEIKKLTNLRNLTSLGLDNNQLSHIPFEMTQLVNLESVSLYDNPITNEKQLQWLMPFCHFEDGGLPF